jgi:outer membrane protein assembly factor BamC
MNKHFINFLLLLTLSGCSGMTDYVKNIISDPRNEKLVYKTDEDYSSRQIDLVIPPNLNRPKTIDVLMLPEVIDNDSDKLFTIDTKLEGIKIYKQGQDMFLSVETQDKLILWNRIKSFWLEEGFQLLSEDLTISSMKTNYLENLSEVQLGAIQRVVGRYVPLLVSPETRDSYKTRIIKKDNGFDIVVSHYGKEFMSDGDSEFRWQNRPRDNEFQNEMISRMYIYLGGNEAKNSGYIIAKTTGIRNAVSIYTDEQGLQTLYIPDIYERVYPSIVSSLDILGVKIIEKNQSSGSIKISLDEKTEDSKGFLAKIFGDNSSQVMNIKVTSGGVNSESTLIVIEDDSFVHIQTLASDEVLRGLYVKLK